MGIRQSDGGFAYVVGVEHASIGGQGAQALPKKMVNEFVKTQLCKSIEICLVAIFRGWAKFSLFR